MTYKDKVRKKTHELRSERVNLIKSRVKEVYKKDIEVSSAGKCHKKVYIRYIIYRLKMYALLLTALYF